MSFSVIAQGVEEAKARLNAIGRRLDPVLRGALNTTASKARNERYIAPLRGCIKASRLRRALVLKRANTRRMEARIIPSSSGIRVLDYKSWGWDYINATRARIWVRGPLGKKIAAGFVNPSGRKQQPLSTRSQRTGRRNTYTYRNHRDHPSEALGISVAYWFQQLTDRSTLNWVNQALRDELERRIQRELLR